jgi:hypothetical protein
MIEQTIEQSNESETINQNDQSQSTTKIVMTEPQPQQESQQQIYEQSVMDKEKLLMGSFNKLNLNGNNNGINNNLVETNNNLNLINNGKGDGPTTDLIISGNGSLASNGHEKNSIESAL